MTLNSKIKYQSLSKWRGALGCLSSLKFIIPRALFWALWAVTDCHCIRIP